METLRTLLATFGAPGAVRNAEAAVLARRSEELVIARLSRRMAELDRALAVQPAA